MSDKEVTTPVKPETEKKPKKLWLPGKGTPHRCMDCKKMFRLTRSEMTSRSRAKCMACGSTRLEQFDLDNPPKGVHMNKTFLLTAVASYTEGSMLLVIDSLDDFVEQFKAYHAKKRDFMLDGVPEFYAHLGSGKTCPHSSSEWYEICNRRSKLETEFFVANNNKPFNFEFSTGCTYIKEGKGAGNFYDGLKITTNEKEDNCWLVLKEFLSDLPTGTHYCGDYCS